MGKYIISILFIVLSLHGSDQSLFSEQEFKTYCALQILINNVFSFKKAYHDPFTNLTTGGLGLQKFKSEVVILTPWGCFKNDVGVCMNDQSDLLQQHKHMFQISHYEQNCLGPIICLKRVENIYLKDFSLANEVLPYTHDDKHFAKKLEVMKKKYDSTKDAVVTVKIVEDGDSFKMVIALDGN